MGWGTRALAAATLIGVTGAQAGTFTARFENDLFYKADREYTTGEGFSWTEEPKTDGWANDVAHWLPWYPEGEVKTRASYALDQSLFTPTDISLANPVASDRP